LAFARVRVVLAVLAGVLVVLAGVFAAVPDRRFVVDDSIRRSLCTVDA
jgi:hypothetical protein